MDSDVFIAVSGRTRIPVRNLWLLLLYASEFYAADHKRMAGIEEAPDELPQLLAEILADAVEQRLNSPLTPAFQLDQADLRRVRGRIDVRRTATKSLLAKGQVACRFDSLSIDTPRNRLARHALLGISKLVPEHQLRTRCRRLAASLERLGVGSTAANPGVDSFNRNDKDDRRFVYAARLAIALALPRPQDGPGQGLLHAPELTEGRLRSLFEAAAGGLYKAALPAPSWNVRTGTHLSWPTASLSAGMPALLPGMKIDIMIHNQNAGHRTIIDTKFTSILGSSHYGTDRFKSSHLYQLYTYLRSQERPEDAASLTTSGVLLYPSTGENIHESMTLHGHTLALATVDLMSSPTQIRHAFLSPVLGNHPASGCSVAGWELDEKLGSAEDEDREGDKRGREMVPGVAAEGQLTVQSQLANNPAADHFLKFLAETSAWPDAAVHGIKPPGRQAGSPLDYTRYLRIRRRSLHVGAFVYTHPVDGRIDFRLAFDSDEQLHGIAPDAWRLAAGNAKYRTSIRILDKNTLGQALELASMAYKRIQPSSEDGDEAPAI